MDLFKTRLIPPPNDLPTLESDQYLGLPMTTPLSLISVRKTLK
jgi:hypothetical protein